MIRRQFLTVRPKGGMIKADDKPERFFIRTYTDNRRARAAREEETEWDANGFRIQRTR